MRTDADRHVVLKTSRACDDRTLDRRNGVNKMAGAAQIDIK
jgi:hypothetical protein